MQADQLVSPEHGILAAVIVALNYGLRMLDNYLRKRKRGDSLKEEVSKELRGSTTVEEIAQREVQRILNLTAAQNAGIAEGTRRDMIEVKDGLLELKERQADIGGEVRSMAKQLDDIRWGIVDMVSQLKPSLVKGLKLRGEVR